MLPVTVSLGVFKTLNDRQFEFNKKYEAIKQIFMDHKSNSWSPLGLPRAQTGVPNGAARQNTRSTGQNCAGWEIEHWLLNLLENLYKHHAGCEFMLQRGF